MSLATKTDTRADAFLNREATSTEKPLAKLEAQVAQLESRVERALQLEPAPHPVEAPQKPARVTIWGVPFSSLTLSDTLRHIDRLIAWGAPGYFITANLNYCMLTDQHRELAEVNDNASFIVCDGMPMVWRSRLLRHPLPERVTGSELIYALTQWAAARRYRVFFLGGAPGVAQTAAERLAARYPELQIAGVESPPFRPLTEAEETELTARIRAAAPDIVYVALGQPKGELWIARNAERMGAPVCVQIGASFDFVAGAVARAPRWLQRAGLEWFYRMCQEPSRLAGRYWNNGLFLIKAIFRDVVG